MSFIGIYKALYAYVPQSPQELAVDENDILYLLERSDVDDWWTVKKRVVGSDVEEPVGLVPSNYIEEADIIGSASALYDYEKQTDEELTFSEGDQFQVYDDKDPDWILVSKNQQEYGFVPSNYIELKKGNSLGAIATPVSTLPPPTHPSLSASKVDVQSQQALQAEQLSEQPDNYVQESSTQLSPPHPTSTTTYDHEDDYASNHRRSARQPTYHSDEEDHPPPKPERPGQSSSYSREPSGSSRSQPQQDDYDDQLYTWQVSEVDGRKKKKAMLAIGNSTIYFSPDSVNGRSPQQWNIKDLISYSSEKKHVFLEFKNPLYSLEIHAGSKDVATQIINILGELKGSVSSNLLNEVKKASVSSSSKSNRKQGKVLYSFQAQGDDELTVDEGELVYIINDKKSKDWWMVESVTSGRSGVIPSQFVNPIKESSSFASKFKLSRSKSKDNLKSSPSKNASSDKLESPIKRLATPKPSRVRTWEDRTGNFKVEAEFLGVVEGKIHLHKTNGVKIAVAADKLSLTDLEYVERVTGMSLESYKEIKSKSKARAASEKEERERKERRERERKRRDREEKDRQRDRDELEYLKNLTDKERQKYREEREHQREIDERERQRDREERDILRRELSEAKRLAAEAKSIARDTPPQQPSRPTSTAPDSTSSSSRNVPTGPSKHSYDWFEFFLEAGVDVNQCQRYTNNFDKEQIDPSIIESIDSSILRTLGLREGDIIRVTRYLDQKFNRQSKESQSQGGGLFSEPSGALKVNRTGSSTQVGGSLPNPAQAAPASTKPDDDAWTVKPAFSNESKPQDSSSQFQTQQFTGSLQDLVNLQPLQPTATASSVKSISQPLQPVKTNSSVVAPQRTGTITAQPTGVALDPFKTGGANILPLTTGGAFVYLPIQQTGALALQPTGLIPLQKTGGLVPAFTGALNPALTGGLVPLQKTGGLNGALTGGLVPLQRTGGFSQTQSIGSIPPTTSFGLNPALTGGLPASLTGQKTGFATQPFNALQPTAGFPQTSFAGQSTGVFSQASFGTQSGFPQTLPQTFPQTNFSAQPTNGFLQTNAIGQATGFGSNNFANQPQATGFGQIPFQPQQQLDPSRQSTFNLGAPTFNQQLNQLSDTFQNTSLQSQTPYQTGFQPQPPYQTGFQSQLPPVFGNGFQQQPGFDGFGQQQPLEAQPTGFGFGNSAQPFGQQQQQFGQRANLANATADNPFGF